MLWHKVALVLVPIVLLLNVYQSKKFRSIQRQISIAQRHRIQVIEENKKLIARIAILSSPQRIDSLSTNSSKLAPISANRVLRILLPEETERP